ncbi:WXG100 family type VII secretion target [Nocardia arthritidis]|nr:WXG100 family type VII secretion target [Nocardia arthritidis]
MAGSLKASPDALNTFSKTIQQKHSDLLTEIGRVRTAEQTTTATWDGEAKRAFEAFMEQYFTQAQKMNDKLQETAEKIVKAGTQYQDRDDQNAQAVKNVVSSLDLPS